MAYTPTTWENGVTPINAGNLNKMEQGIKAAHEDVREVSVGGTGKDTHTLNSVLIGNGTDPVNNIATASGAFYATAENGEPKFGVLPIGQGGTGKKNAADALAALGGISIEKVWENKSPTSTFGSQDIKLDLSNGDKILLEAKNIAEDTTTAFHQVFPIKIDNTQRRYGIMTDYLVFREIKASSTGVWFSDGHLYASFGNASVTNQARRFIPMAIYIVKGVQ